MGYIGSVSVSDWDRDRIGIDASISVSDRKWKIWIAASLMHTHVKYHTHYRRDTSLYWHPNAYMYSINTHTLQIMTSIQELCMSPASHVNLTGHKGVSWDAEFSPSLLRLRWYVYCTIQFIPFSVHVDSHQFLKQVFLTITRRSLVL